MIRTIVPKLWMQLAPSSHSTIQVYCTVPICEICILLAILSKHPLFQPLAKVVEPVSKFLVGGAELQPPSNRR